MWLPTPITSSWHKTDWVNISACYSGGRNIEMCNQGQMLIIVLSQAYTVDTKEH